ncbi:MAG: PKD domain-containing protein [Bacteroidia bacterium]|nr:PKD domain-containing protein [Bacteroidia bacterium]
MSLKITGKMEFELNIPEELSAIFKLFAISQGGQGGETSFRVDSVFPAAAASNVSTAGLTPSITFNKSPQKSSDPSLNIQIIEQGGPTLSLPLSDPNVSVIGQELRIINQSFAPEKTYTILIPEGAFLSDSDQLSQLIEWSFSTEANQDLVAIIQDLTNQTRLVRVFSSEDSSGDIQSYLWDFGDGNTSSRANPVHIYPDTPAGASYQVSLSLTDSQGENTTAIYNLNIPAEPSGATLISDPGFHFDVDEAGTRSLYYDGSMSSGNPVSFTWSGSGVAGVNRTNKVGSVVIPSIGEKELNLNVVNASSQSSRHIRAFTARNTVKKDRAVCDFGFDVSGRTVDFTQRCMPGTLGIASYEWSYQTKGSPFNVFSTDPNPVLAFPIDGLYGVRLRITTNPHPVSGEVDFEDAYFVIRVSNTQVQNFNLITSRTEWDTRPFARHQAVKLAGASTESFGATNFTAPVFTGQNEDGLYVGQGAEVVGGLEVDTKSGEGETTTEAAAAASLMNRDYVMRLAAYLGNPFLGSDPDQREINSDWNTGPSRLQASTNDRRVPSLEDEIPAGQNYYQVYGFIFGLNSTHNINHNGERRGIIVGSYDTLEGHLRSLEGDNFGKTSGCIEQGTQTKKTVLGDEGGPTQSIDTIGNRLTYQCHDVGSTPTVGDDDIINDYPVSGNGRRIDLVYPYRSVDEGIAYLLVELNQYDGDTGRGKSRTWLVPLGRQTGLDHNLKPQITFENFNHVEEDDTPGVFSKVVTAGFYNARSGQNRESSIKAAQIGIGENTMFLSPDWFYQEEKGVGIAIPNDEDVIGSVLTHFGLIS